MNKIYVVGMGPGKKEFMTFEAENALKNSDLIIGYTVYLDLLKSSFPDKEYLSTPIRREEERCRMCFEEAMKGKQVSMVCSGDAGVYGMASRMYHIGKDYPQVELEIIPGVTAALSGAAVLGAPINHDFCLISLSDLLTPWEIIEKRIRAACMGDFAIVLYNPSSRKRADYLKRACEIMLESVEEERPCGFVRNIGRDQEEYTVCTLGQLKNTAVDMFTTVFIGNSTSEIINGKLITKRGYLSEK